MEHARRGTPQQSAADYDNRQDIPDAKEVDLVKRQKAPQAVTVDDKLFEHDPRREKTDEDGRFDQKRQVLE
jgi:hypothetical protein